jgi:predicted site-specific integrase-resolvase
VRTFPISEYEDYDISYYRKVLCREIGLSTKQALALLNGERPWATTSAGDPRASLEPFKTRRPFGTNAAAYLRVSTEGQVGKDKFGLAAQREAVEQYASAQGFDLVAWYEDDGVSGVPLDRPGLMALLDGAKADEFKAVVVAKMDRVARDRMAQL